MEKPLNLVLQAVAAFAGGMVGALVSAWLLQHGFYAMVIPGALAGFGAGIFRTRFISAHIACGIWALAVGVFAEWRFHYWLTNPSFEFFIAHLRDKSPLTWAMIAAGGFLGFYIPFSRRAEAARANGGAPMP